MSRAMAGILVLLLVATGCGRSAGAGAGYEVEWFDAPTADPISQGALQQLLAEPWPDPVDVQPAVADGGGMPITLDSCSDYLEVADLQVHPVAGGNMRVIFQARALNCQALALTLAARPAVVSHLRTLAFDEHLPDQLPWQVAMITSASEAERIADERPHATWRQALFVPLTEFSPCGPHCGRYRNPNQMQVVRLVARGDFDADGIEDVLISSHDAALGGSYRAGRMLLLTRLEPDGRIELLQGLGY